MSVQVGGLRAAPAVVAQSFLSVPPFPGARVNRFSVEATIAAPRSQDPDKAADLLRARRVGGTYWARQPELEEAYVLVRSSAPLSGSDIISDDRPVVLWSDQVPQPVPIGARTVVTGPCDPWHMLSRATALISPSMDAVALIAGLLGVPVYQPQQEGLCRVEDAELTGALNAALVACVQRNPFTGELMDLRETIELCGFWRDLIDGNRELEGGLGFAFWKRENVGALLWDGTHPFRFVRSASELESRCARVAVWRSKVSDEELAAANAQGRTLIEVEDGFLRSNGLGADCVPPLSITVDRLGAYFDPAQPSELEVLLQDGEFDPALVERAACLREAIVASGLSKYARGDDGLERPAGERRHILVPGQVEDDRSVLTGGCGVSTNLELLKRVRERVPGAYVLYKPHPDVVAGHRRGGIQDQVGLEYADEIVADTSITSLIAMVDEVHVNTSLAGFEALLRGTPVTTYGVPFYAGWGLTTDLGPVPERRTAKRGLNELVAAALFLYPRYLDPESGLPCPPEVVVARLSDASSTDDGLIVTMRRLQGKFMRSVRSLLNE